MERYIEKDTNVMRCGYVHTYLHVFFIDSLTPRRQICTRILQEYVTTVTIMEIAMKARLDVSSLQNNCHIAGKW